MAIEMLDMKKQWAKIKAGFRTNMLWSSPAKGPNPSGYKNGRDPLTAQGQVNTGPSAFTGKTFSARKG